MKQTNFKSIVHCASSIVHSFKSLTLLLVLMVGVSEVWGTVAEQTSFSAVSGNVNGDKNISYATAKSGGTNTPVINGTAIRLYRKSSNSAGLGSTLTITPASGITISEVVFSLNSSLGYSYKVDGGSATTGTAKSITITCSATSSVMLQNNSKSQMDVTGIKVTYSGDKTLESISVKTTPKILYVEGDYFDPTGLVITKTFDDSSTEDLAYAGHESDFTFSPTTSTALTTSNNKVTITVSEKSVNQGITVNAKTEATIKLSEAGSVTTVTGQTYYVGDEYTLPTCTAECGDKVFRGWSTESVNQETEPTSNYYKAGDKATLTSAETTFYAVFADEGEGGAASSITSFATGEYYLIDTYDSKYYATSGTGTIVTSVDITAAVTVNKDGTISVDASKDVITSSMVYTIAGTASEATVQNKDNKSYIGGSGSTSFNTGNTNKWSVSEGSGDNADRFTFVYSSRCVLYRSGYDFRNYGTGNRDASGYGTGYLYLVPTTGGKSYSNYTTSCSTAPSPKVTMIGTLNAFTYPATLGPSAAQSVTVSGSNLTADITVSASTNYEVCLTENGTYTSSVTLTQASGSVAETTVYVRLAAGIEQTASIPGTLTAASTNATSKVINLSGSVTVAPITSIAGLIQATTSTETEYEVSISNWVVTGTTSGNVYLTDGTGNGILSYKYSHGFSANDKLNSGSNVVKLKTKLYNGFAEITNLTSSITNLSVSHDGSISPIVKTLDETISSNMQGVVITVNGVTYNSTTSAFEKGGKSIAYNSSLYNTTTPQNGQKYNITGVVIMVNSGASASVAPRSADDIVELNCEVNPTITAATADNIGEDAATLHCASGITAIGENCEIESYGFEYGTSSTLEGATSVEVGTSYTTAGTAFETTLSSLTPNTKYYYRAYATNGKGTAYSSDIANFTTEQSTTPILGLNKSAIDFGTKLSGQSYQETFVITGSTLTENVTITGASAPITLSKSIFTAAEVMAEGGVTVTVTLTPTEKATVNQTLTISSGSATQQELTISAETQVPYVVTFNVPSSVTAPVNQNITPGEAADLTVEPTGTITGATFLGWVATAQAEETTTKIDPLTSFTPEADANLYALYKRVDAVDKEGYKLSISTGSNTYYLGANCATITQKSDAAIFPLNEAGYLSYYTATGSLVYLYNSSDNTTVSTSSTKPDYTWNFNENVQTSTFTLTSSASGGRMLLFNSSGSYFKAYASSNYGKSGYYGDFKKESATMEVGTTYYSTNPAVVEISGITVTTEPTKKDYFEGDNFDATGMVVKAQYTGGKADKIITDYTVVPSTNLVAGTDQVTISYGGKTTPQAITVTAIELSKIELNTDNVQKTFLQNAEFNSNNLVVNAFFNDATKNRTLESNEYTVSTPDMSQLGKQTITVSYTYKEGNTKEATYEIQINSALNGITLNTDNVKKTYIETETFDPANLGVTASYGADEPKVVTENITYFIGDDQITSATVLAGLNTLDAATNKTITVKYTEFGSTVSNTYNVTVNPYPRYSVTFMEKGAQKGDVLTETQGQGGVTAPTATATIGEYTFVGWSATNPETETTVKPETVTLTGGKYYPTAHITLYAIYATDKEADFQGFTLNMKVGSTTYYVAGFSNKEFTNTQVAASAMTLWYSGGYLFYKNGETTTYVYGSGNDLKTATAKKDASTAWSTTTVGDSIYFHYSNRWIAWNGQQNTNYWRSYAQSSNGQHLFKQSAGEVGRFVVPNYTTMPDSRSIPDIKFTTNKVNTNVLTDASDHTSLATYTNNTLSTDNTEGAKTYSLADGDDAVASINSSTGEVTAKKAGAVTVTVTIEGTAEWFEGSASYSLTFDKMTPTIQFVDVTENKATIYTGAANKVTFTATTNSDATIEYSSSSTTYATIDAATGETEGKAAGSCTLYAGLAATDLYKAVTDNSRAKVTLTVKSNAKTQTLKFDKASYEIPNGSSPEDFTNELTGAKTTVHYESNNTALATVNETSGLVHIVSTATPGTATITATAKAGNVVEEGITYAYSASEPVSYTISVNYPKPVITIDNEAAIVGGVMRGSQNVTLTATDALYIIYTTDGTEPTWDPYNGTEYEAPFLVETSCTVKAIAVGGNEEVSPVAEMSFTKADDPVVLLKVNDEAKDPDYSYNVKMSDAVVLNATACKINYQVTNSNDVVVAEGTNCSATTPLSFTKGGTYTVTASAKWDKTRGFTGETRTWTIEVTGPAHLPIHMTENGNNLPPYMTKSGTVGKYDGITANVKIEKEESYIMASFLDKPETLSFDFIFRGGSEDVWTDLGNVFTVKQSANGSNWNSTLFTIDKNTKSAGESLVKETIYTFSFTTADGLNEATRYIKWEYTTKETGNIGVGNIKISGATIVIDGVDVVDIPDDYSGNVVVAAGGTATINGEKTLGDMTVQDGGTLNISTLDAAVELSTLTIEAGGKMESYTSNLTVDNFCIKSIMGANTNNAKSGSMQAAALTATTSAYIDITLDQNLGHTGYGWYAFAVPFEVDALTGIQASLDGESFKTDMKNETNYAIMDYHTDIRATGSYGWKKYRGTLKPGTMYVITTDDDYKVVRFVKATGATISLASSTDITTTLAGSDDAHKNWNGIANPNLCISDFVDNSGANYLYFYNHDGNNFVNYQKGTISTVVGSPFMIQAVDNSITMKASTTVRPYHAPARVAEEEAKPICLQISQNGAHFTDQLYLAASDEATTTYQVGHDLSKAYMSGEVTVAQLWCNAYSMKLAAAELPWNSNDEVEYSISLFAPKAGTYTLTQATATNNDVYLLKDNAIVWNLSLGAYDIDLNKGENTGYSIRVADRTTPTGVGEANASEDGIQKFIYDERLVIIRNGKVYNGAGALVK